MNRSSHITIRGNRWKFVLGRPPVNNCCGYIDWSLRTIWVRTNKKTNRRATAIHEVLHAALPDLEESAVEETEEALETVLKLLDEKKR